MDKCQKCGGKTGLEAVHRFTQLYDWNGEPAGYEFDRPYGTTTAVCCDCGRRFKLSDLEADALRKDEDVYNDIKDLPETKAFLEKFNEASERNPTYWEGEAVEIDMIPEKEATHD